jgi:hypothetical protein
MLFTAAKVVFLRNEKLVESETIWPFEGEKFGSETHWKSSLQLALDTPGLDDLP